MKKALSIILSAVMLLTTLGIGFTAYADMLEEKAIDNFIDNSCKTIRKYDSDKEFISKDENVSVYNSEKNENFQTCRLIVKSASAFNDFGAIEHIKGFMDFHILQYENESNTENAYKSLLTEKNVLSVNIDKIVSPVQVDEEESDTSTDVFPESSNGHLCDWATERTQSAQINEYIKKNNISLTDLTVGVIDTGVDYNHEFLKDRIVRTNFNFTTDGNDNDELDLIDGHGTATSSVVVDNTPDSVSVAVYRVLDDEGDNSIVGICAGILQAISDNVDIISMSIAFADENGLTKSACKLAYEKDIPIVCSSGNEGRNIIAWNYSPAKFETAITVGATSRANRICSWSNNGLYIDFVVPGEDVNVAVPNNKYDVWSGTSFATPCVAGIIALIKTANIDYSYDKIEKILKQSTIFSLNVYVNNEIYTDENSNRETIYNFKKTQYPYTIDCPFKQNGYGLIQLNEIFKINIPDTPKCNYKSGNYTNEINIELKSDLPIYYTLDGSYPTTSSTLYTEPIAINKDTDLRCVAYDETATLKYSRELECEYQIFQVGTENMFEIDEAGCITKYNSDTNLTNLSVPSEIKGITVKTFASQVFNDGIISKIIFPQTLEEIPQKAFYENTNLYYVNTGGAKAIQNQAFYNCRSSLHTLDMPNVEEIVGSAFKSCFGVFNYNFKINAPKLKCIQREGFYNCNLSIVAPLLETLYDLSFYYCSMIEATFPNLTTVKKTGVIGKAPFMNCAIFILDLPNLENIECNYIANGDNGIQYINTPRFSGKISDDYNYEFLNYYNISKKAADKNKINYYDIDSLGGSIRVTDAGLRFGFSYDESQNSTVQEYGFVYTNQSIDHTLLTCDNVDNKSIIKFKANNRKTKGNITSFNLVLTSVPKSAYDMDITARAYVKVDGMYFYSEPLTRSFNQVANAVLADEEIDQNTKDKLNNLLKKV